MERWNIGNRVIYSQSIGYIYSINQKSEGVFRQTAVLRTLKGQIQNLEGSFVQKLAHINDAIMKNLLLFLSITSLISVQINAQANESDPIKTLTNDYSRIDTLQHYNTEFSWKPSTSIYLELMGKGVYSLNVDFRKKETRAISIGIQYFEAVWPSVMFYYLGGVRHRFETGIGSSAIITGDGLEGVSLNGVIGYRYQKKKGLIFRAGFTPLFLISLTGEGSNRFLPFIGLSLGYSF